MSLLTNVCSQSPMWTLVRSTSYGTSGQRSMGEADEEVGRGMRKTNVNVEFDCLSNHDRFNILSSNDS